MESIRKKRIQRGLILLVLFTLLITVVVSLNRRSDEEEAESAVVEVEESAVIPLEEEVRSAESVVYSHQRESRKVFNDGFPLGDHEQLKDVHRDLKEDFLRRIEPDSEPEPEPETEPETQLEPEPEPEPIVVAATENADPEDKNENKEKETKNEETTEKKSEEKEEKKEITDLSVHPGIYNIKGTSTALSESGWESLQRWRKGILDLADRNRDLIRINGDTSKKLVALTFDDGPDSSVTPRVMDILKRYHVPGNFFFVGRNVQNHPQVVKRAHDEGHMVLSHSFKHSNYNNLSHEDIEKDFRKTNRAIEEITGTFPQFMRPPYGIVNENVIKAAREHQQKIIIWSTDSMDWSQQDKKNISRNVLENVRPGEIILLHSSGGNTATAEALPGIIEGLIAKGYKIVRLDEMFE